MGVTKPTGEYADEMLDPGGWVEIDEQTLYDRAQVYTQILQQMTSSLEGLQHERSEIFDGGVWEGGAANAAKGKLNEVIEELTGLQQHLVNAITWYRNAGDTVADTKSKIADRVEATQQQIGELEDDSDSDSDDQADAIASLVDQAHSDNAEDVTSAAVRVPTAGSWKPPVNALQNLLNQKSPPSTTKPGQHPSGPPPLSGKPGTGPVGAPAQRPGQVPSPTSEQPGAPLPPSPGSGDVHRSMDNAGQPNAASPAAPAKPHRDVPRDPAGPAAPAAASPPAAPAGSHRDVPRDPAGPAAPAAASPPAAPAGSHRDVPRDPAGPAAPAALTPPGLMSATPTPAGASVNPADVMGPVSGGLGGLGGLGGGGGHGGGGGDLGSMWSNGLGGQSGGPQTLFSGDALGHHPDPGLQQGLNQSAMNSSAASAAASSAAQVPLAASANAAMVAPAAAQGMPVTSDAQAAVAASGSAASGISGGHGGGVGSAMSPAPMMSDAGASASSPMPLLPPATPHPAAPVSATGSGTTGTPGASGSGSGGPGVHPASTTGAGRGGFGGGPMMSSQAEAAPAPIPVSSARAEKEAIAQATRRHAGGDVQMAYRLAAALNADNMVNKGDFNFFWMTAVSADGQIVVANSYGLGYIPEVVALPAQVRMASADAGIPVAERARWTTYPSIALQGWAAHHNTTLRVVIGRERHFAGIDPGVPTQFMADEDIPTGGKMEGRSRLEVVAPADAARLTAAGDLALIDLLPPAPVDTTAPADQCNTLWFDVIKHLMSSDPDRGARQLEAFATYAAHAQELALRRAHTSVHAVEQRQTVADWLYWHHLHGVLGEALAGV